MADPHIAHACPDSEGVTRRALLLALPTAGVALALPAAAPAETAEDRATRLLREVFAALAEAVPEGTILCSVLLSTDRDDFHLIHMTARDPARMGRADPYWNRGLGEPWVFHAGAKGDEA